MVLLVLEAHGPLHFGRRIDERAQRITRQRVIVAARVNVFEFSSLVVMSLCVFAGEKESLDFVGGVQGVAFLLVQVRSKRLQHATNVGPVRSSALVDDLAEDQDLPGSKHVSRSPVCLLYT